MAFFLYAPTKAWSTNTGSFTLSVWVNPTGTITNKAIAGKAEELRVFTDANAKPGCQIKSGTWQTAVVSSRALTASSWAHIICSYDLNTLKIFVNGLPAGSQVLSAVPDDTANTLKLGQDDSASTPYTNVAGTFDEIKVWQYAVTNDEVKQEYNRAVAANLSVLGTNASYSSQASAQQYCIPGDTASCSGPVLEWNFEEGGGSTVYDTTGNNNYGTWHGTGIHYGTGKLGKTGAFNGDMVVAANTDYVSLSNAGNLVGITPAAITFETWVKATSTSASGNGVEIFEDGCCGNYSFWWNNAQNGAAISFISGGTSLGSGSINNFIGKWHHIAGTDDGTTMKIYVDSILSGTKPHVAFTGLRSINVGARGGTNQAFPGKIDQFRVFTYARSSAQIAYDYNRGAPIAQWKMNECTGTTINDATGNMNTGTLTVGASGTQTQAGTCTDGNSASAWYNGRSGKRNSGLSFDGTDDYITYPTSLPIPSNSYSISLWFKPATAAPTSSQKSLFWILDNNGATNSSGIEFGCGSSSSTTKVRALHRRNGTADDICSNDSFTLNNWHHAILVYDPSQTSKTKLYVDGILEASGSSGPSGTMTLSSITAAVINQVGTLSRYFDGQLDDIRVYNYALTNQQVKMLYTDGALNYAPLSGNP